MLLIGVMLVVAIPAQCSSPINQNEIDLQNSEVTTENILQMNSSDPQCEKELEGNSDIFKNMI